MSTPQTYPTKPGRVRSRGSRVPPLRLGVYKAHLLSLRFYSKLRRFLTHVFPCIPFPVLPPSHRWGFGDVSNRATFLDLDLPETIKEKGLVRARAKFPIPLLYFQIISERFSKVLSPRAYLDPRLRRSLLFRDKIKGKLGETKGLKSTSNLGRTQGRFVIVGGLR